MPPGIRDPGGHGVTATCEAIGVDGRVGVVPADSTAGAGPSVIQGVPGIEVAGGRARADRLAGHDLAGLDRAAGADRRSGFAAQHEHQATLQSYTPDFSFWSRGRRAIAVVGVNEVGPQQPQRHVRGQVDIKAAAGHDAQLLDVVKGIRHEAMVTDQHFQEWRKAVVPEGKLRTQ